MLAKKELTRRVGEVHGKGLYEKHMRRHTDAFPIGGSCVMGNQLPTQDLENKRKNMHRHGDASGLPRRGRARGEKRVNESRRAFWNTVKKGIHGKNDIEEGSRNTTPHDG